MSSIRLSHSSKAALGLAFVTVCLSGQFALARPSAPPAPSRELDSVYALTGAEIVVGTGSVISNGTLIIRDGIIERVGPELPVPFDAKTIDCTGLRLYPGFIDAATHLGMPEEKVYDEVLPKRDDDATLVTETILTRTRESNRKGIRTGIRAAQWISLNEEGGKKHREAGFTSVLTSPKGQLLSGRSALINLSGQIPRHALVRTEVAHHGSFRTRGDGYPQTTMGVMAHLRQLFHDTRHYDSLWKVYRESNRGLRRPPIDPVITELLPLLDRAPLIFRASRENSIRRLLDLANEFNLNIIIDGGREAYRLVGELKRLEHPVLVEVDFPDKPQTRADKAAEKKKAKAKKKKKKEEEEDAKRADEEPPTEKPTDDSENRVEKENADASDDTKGKDPKKESKKKDDDEDLEPERVLEDKKRAWKEDVANAVALHRAGVPFAFTTRNLTNPKDLFKQVRTIIEAGLPEDAAVAALTIQPARILGVQRQLGTLEVGKIANVVVAKGTLAEEDFKVQSVFVDGRQFEITSPKEKKGPAGEGDESSPAKFDLTGTWDVVTEGETGTMDSTMTLTQEGNTFSGSLDSRMGIAKISSGTIKGTNVSLVITFDIGGQEIVMDITAEVSEDGNSFTGKLETPFGQDATVTATRAEPPGEYSCCDQEENLR